MKNDIARIALSALFILGTVGTAAYSAPGDRDISFGQGGGFYYAVPGTPLAVVNRVFLQSDGKLVAVGATTPTSVSSQNTLITRFNADGSLDATFGGVGTVILDLTSAGLPDQAFGGAQQVDNKLIIVGQANSRIVAVRLLANGNVDSTFGSGGAIVIQTGGVSSGVEVLPQSDGSIVLAGLNYQGTNTGNDYWLRKLLPNGTPDTTPGFGIAGSAILTIGTGTVMGSYNEQPTRAIQQPDGKIIILGRSVSSTGMAYGLSVARANADGSLDIGFANGGYIFNACAGPCIWNAAALQSNGKILLAGTIFQSLPTPPSLQQDESYLMRLNVDGTVDTTFGSNGDGVIRSILRRHAPTFIPAGDQLTGLVIDPATQAIAVYGALTWRLFNSPGASGTVNAFGAMAAARLTPAGALDTAFGTNGVAIATLGTQSAPNGAAITLPKTLIAQPDGRLVVAGSSGQYVAGVLQAGAISMARLLSVGSDPGVFSMSTTGPVDESIGSVNVRVFRQSGRAGAVSVAYSTNSGTAIAGSDFTQTNGTLSWADGDYSTRTVTIPIIADGIPEASDESFSLVLSGATGGSQLIGNGGAAIVIARDDVPPATSLSLTQSAVSTTETAGLVQLTVNRTGTEQVSVGYYTLAESAIGGTDFVVSSGTLAWVNGETGPKDIVLTLLNDSVSDGTKTLRVVLVLPGGGPVMGTHAAQITIADDEPPAPAGNGSGGGDSSGSGGGAIDPRWLLAMSALLGLIAFRRRFDRRQSALAR